MSDRAIDLAVIGGTGFNRMEGVEQRAEHHTDTPYGEISAAIAEMDVRGTPALFLARHGSPHRLPPHCINYRANLWALRELGVTRVLAINAVGGITPPMGAGVIAVPDQIIDYTYGREHSFYDGSGVAVEHVDFSEPYDEELRRRIITVAEKTGCAIEPRGVYATTQGPRLETAAEIVRLERDGADLVGMTGMPEAALARELGLAYASICLVVNPAAGKGTGPITMAEIDAVLVEGMVKVRELLTAVIAELA